MGYQTKIQRPGNDRMPKYNSAFSSREAMAVAPPEMITTVKKIE